MLYLFFALLMLVHGLIHLVGFAKAFNYGKINAIFTEITKLAGIFWLLATLLFCAATVLLLAKIEGWWIIALSGIIVSQLLIYTAWQDAKFGSFANLIVLLMVIIYKI